MKKAREGKKLRIGLLGVAHTRAESYARSIASIVSPAVELTGVYDRNERFGEQFARRHKTAFRRSAERLLSEVDAVIIASENSFHHELAKGAARAGKHILCEKPIALTLEQSREMKEEVRRTRVKFQMCYPLRHHTVASVAKGLIGEGRIGDILAIVGVNKVNSALTADSWIADRKLSGGGAVMDHTVHLADMMRWYTGSEVKEVYCEIGRNVVPRLRVEDAFFTTVTFDNGVLGHIDGSWSYPAGYQTWGDVILEVLGSKGVLFIDVFRQNVNFTGMSPPDDKLLWRGYGCDADTEMVRSFVDCINLDKEPIASIDDGIRGLQITLASYESQRLGRPVRPAR